jgi:hypothetical protein
MLDVLIYYLSNDQNKVISLIWVLKLTKFYYIYIQLNALLLLFKT